MRSFCYKAPFESDDGSRIGWGGMWHGWANVARKTNQKPRGLSSKGLIIHRLRGLSSWIGDFSFVILRQPWLTGRKIITSLYYVTLFFIQGDLLNFMEYAVGMVPKLYSWPRGQCPCVFLRSLKCGTVIPKWLPLKKEQQKGDFSRGTTPHYKLPQFFAGMFAPLKF